jgi:hypothetical protein
MKLEQTSDHWWPQTDHCILLLSGHTHTTDWLLCKRWPVVFILLDPSPQWAVFKTWVPGPWLTSGDQLTDYWSLNDLWLLDEHKLTTAHYLTTELPVTHVWVYRRLTGEDMKRYRLVMGKEYTLWLLLPGETDLNGRMRVLQWWG